LTDPTTTAAPGTLPGRPRAHPEGPRPSRQGSRSNYEQPVRRPRPLLDGEPRRIQGLEVKDLEYQSDPQSTRLDLRPVPPRERPTGANHPGQPPPSRLTNRSPYQSEVPPNDRGLIDRDSARSAGSRRFVARHVSSSLSVRCMGYCSVVGRKPRSTGAVHVVTNRRQGKHREYAPTSCGAPGGRAARSETRPSATSRTCPRRSSSSCGRRSRASASSPSTSALRSSARDLLPPGVDTSGRGFL